MPTSCILSFSRACSARRGGDRIKSFFNNSNIDDIVYRYVLVEKWVCYFQKVVLVFLFLFRVCNIFFRFSVHVAIAIFWNAGLYPKGRY